MRRFPCNPCSAETDWNLCGHVATSNSQLYFDVAKSPSAHPLRATASESIIEDEADETLWTFVVQPVTAVVCRRGPAAAEARCTGDEIACGSLVARLKSNPRAKP